MASHFSSQYARAGLYCGLALLPLGLAAGSAIPPAGFWSEAATATGLVGGTMLMLQFVTSGRFEALTGRIGIDVTMAFHKWTARVLFAFVLAHPALLIAPTLLVDPAVGFERFAAMVASPRNLTGVIAWTLVVISMLLAVFRDRMPFGYEAWRATHLLMGLAAAGFVAWHAVTAGTYSAGTPLGAIWIAFTAMTLLVTGAVYVLRSRALRDSPWRVVANERVADDMWHLTLRAESGPSLAYRAGQFVWLTIAPRLFPLFDHPFSIASAPSAGPDLAFIIKRSGDFTDRIGAIAPGTQVGLDGPHGSFTLDSADADAVLLIAGGVGIAPIVSLLAELAARKDPRPVRLIYAGASPGRMVSPRKLEKIAAGLDFRSTYWAEDMAHHGSHGIGRPGRAGYSVALAGLDPRRILVMVCGPGGMITEATDLLHRLGVPLDRIRYERFDYAGHSNSLKDARVTSGFRKVGLIIATAVLAFALR